MRASCGKYVMDVAIYLCLGTIVLALLLIKFLKFIIFDETAKVCKASDDVYNWEES